jgi:hypothetical protein
MTLHTQRDRQIHQLRKDIERVEVWLAADAGNRRAIAFHRAKLDELRSELHTLLDGEK